MIIFTCSFSIIFSHLRGLPPPCDTVHKTSNLCLAFWFKQNREAKGLSCIGKHLKIQSKTAASSYQGERTEKSFSFSIFIMRGGTTASPAFLHHPTPHSSPESHRRQHPAPSDRSAIHPVMLEVHSDSVKPCVEWNLFLLLPVQRQIKGIKKKKKSVLNFCS